MHLKKKNSETNLKDLNMKKKLQQNSLLFSYLSIQNTEDIILGFNFFLKKNLQIYMVDLHHNDSNEWVCFLEKKLFWGRKKKILMVLGPCSNIDTWSFSPFFEMAACTFFAIFCSNQFENYGCLLYQGCIKKEGMCLEKLQSKCQRQSANFDL